MTAEVIGVVEPVHGQERREDPKMKKVITVAVLVLAFVAIRRFGPGLRARVIAKCREMMQGAPGDTGTRSTRGDLAPLESEVAGV
jgi:hypothetical protein